jgi:adenylate kinase
MERYKAILLFGAPGSGKGTQGKILGAIPGFFHTACGDIFRSLDLQSEIGKKAWEYSSRGELVPDEFTVRLWSKYIQGMELINQFHPETQFLVLDGIPRNLKQAQLLDDTIDVVKVIHLRCDNLAKMVERLRRRALKENRLDDAKEDVIKNRMQVFERETAPLLAHYARDRVATVNATMSQLRVLSEIIKVLMPLKEQRDHENEVRERAFRDSLTAGKADATPQEVVTGTA